MKPLIQFVIAGGYCLLAGLASAQTPQQAAELEARLAEQGALQEAAVRAQESQLIQLESLSRQLEVARAQVEQAAQQIAVRELPVLPDVPGTRWLANRQSRAQIGAVLVDADGGALVTQLSPGGPADTAGVRVGDLIHGIDGIDLAVPDSRPYLSVLGRLDAIEPGAVVSLGIERGGDDIAIDVTTMAGSDSMVFDREPAQSQIYVRSNAAGGASGGRQVVIGNGTAATVYGPTARVFSLTSSPWGSMELVSMSAGLARYFDTGQGLLVVRGPADESIGIEDGDVILTIGDRTPNSPEHAIRILGSFESGETIELAIMRGGRQTTVEYTVPEQTAQASPAWMRLAPVAADAPAVPLVVEPDSGR